MSGPLSSQHLSLGFNATPLTSASNFIENEYDPDRFAAALAGRFDQLTKEALIEEKINAHIRSSGNDQWAFLEHEEQIRFSSLGVKALFAVLRRRNDLTHLYFSNFVFENKAVEEDFLAGLKELRHVTKLTLNHCIEVDIHPIILSCSELKILIFENCHNLGISLIQTMRECITVESIYFNSCTIPSSVRTFLGDRIKEFENSWLADSIEELREQIREFSRDPRPFNQDVIEEIELTLFGSQDMDEDHALSDSLEGGETQSPDIDEERTQSDFSDDERRSTCARHEQSVARLFQEAYGMIGQKIYKELRIGTVYQAELTQELVDHYFSLKFHDPGLQHEWVSRMYDSFLFMMNMDRVIYINDGEASLFHGVQLGLWIANGILDASLLEEEHAELGWNLLQRTLDYMQDNAKEIEVGIVPQGMDSYCTLDTSTLITGNQFTPLQRDNLGYVDDQLGGAELDILVALSKMLKVRIAIYDFPGHKPIVENNRLKADIIEGDWLKECDHVITISLLRCTDPINHSVKEYDLIVFNKERLCHTR